MKNNVLSASVRNHSEHTVLGTRTRLTRIALLRAAFKEMPL